MNERRSGKRYRCLLFVKFGEEGKGEWAAISRNASQSGLMMAVGKRLKAGEEITLDFRVKPEDDELKVKGRIVRIEEHAEGPYTYWPHRVAVEFIEPLPEVEPRLREMAGSCEEEPESKEDAEAREEDKTSD